MAHEPDIYPLSPFFDQYDEYMQFLIDAEAGRAAELRGQRAQGSRHTHFIQDIGKYVTPRSETWEAYSQAVRQGGLGFNPSLYAFDKELALRCKNRAIYDPSARHYADYEPLRHNLAVLRNFVLNHFYGEELDHREATDTQTFSHVLQVGGALGDILRRGNNPLLAATLQPRAHPKKVNLEYEGAAILYDKLLSVQRHNNLIAPVDFVLNLHRPVYRNRRWNLPPIEVTPFGRINYFAPPPTDSLLAGEALLTDAAFDQAELSSPEMQNLLDSAVLDAGLSPHPTYQSVDSLTQPIKLQAIEIAREILEKLKLQFSGTPVLTMLDYSGSEFKQTMTHINTVIAVYEDHLQRAAYFDPSLLDDKTVTTANDAIGFIGTQIKLKALERAEMLGDAEHAAQIRTELEGVPAHWLNPNSYTSSQLMQALEQGLAMVVATLEITQDSGMEQNQRGLMLQQFTREPDTGMQKERQSLAFDEIYRRMAAERRDAYEAQLGLRRSGGTLLDASPDANKKQQTGKATQSSATSMANGFDTLPGAGVDQMRTSVNAPTSGNYDPGAPNSAKQVVATHLRKSGRKEAQHKQQRQQRQQQQQQHAHRRAQEARSDDNTPAPSREEEAYRPPSLRRDRPVGR